jgi:hypothetical protein
MSNLLERWHATPEALRLVVLSRMRDDAKETAASDQKTAFAVAADLLEGLCVSDEIKPDADTGDVDVEIVEFLFDRNDARTAVQIHAVLCDGFGGNGLNPPSLEDVIARLNVLADLHGWVRREVRPDQVDKYVIVDPEKKPWERN